MISVIQNFICTKEKRLNVIRNEVPNMGKIFKDYEFFINYNTKHYFDEVYEIYRKGIDNLNFYNNLEYNWGLVTLSLIEEVKTPYTMILCEDYEYRIDYDNWKNAPAIWSRRFESTEWVGEGGNSRVRAIVQHDGEQAEWREEEE